MFKIIISLFILLFSFQFVLAQEAMLLPIDSSPLVIKTGAGNVIYKVEVAVTPDENSRGLMYRLDFPKDRAMLFKFDEQREINMWMANTPLPLDMVFLGWKGTVVSIVQDTTPYSHAIISSRVPARYVIELNAGQVKAHSIAVGQQVRHPKIDKSTGSETDGS